MKYLHFFFKFHVIYKFFFKEIIFIHKRTEMNVYIKNSNYDSCIWYVQHTYMYPWYSFPLHISRVWYMQEWAFPQVTNVCSPLRFVPRNVCTEIGWFETRGENKFPARYHLAMIIVSYVLYHTILYLVAIYQGPNKHPRACLILH